MVWKTHLFQRSVCGPGCPWRVGPTGSRDGLCSPGRAPEGAARREGLDRRPLLPDVTGASSASSPPPSSAPLPDSGTLMITVVTASNSRAGHLVEGAARLRPAGHRHKGPARTRPLEGHAGQKMAVVLVARSGRRAPGRQGAHGSPAQPRISGDTGRLCSSPRGVLCVWQVKKRHVTRAPVAPHERLGRWRPGGGGGTRARPALPLDTSEHPVILYLTSCLLAGRTTNAMRFTHTTADWARDPGSVLGTSTFKTGQGKTVLPKVTHTGASGGLGQLSVHLLIPDQVGISRLVRSSPALGSALAA